MTRMLERRFLKGVAVAVALPRDVAAAIGKAYRTLRSYQERSRPVTLDSARALSRYLRKRARAMLKAADALDRTIKREEERNG